MKRCILIALVAVACKSGGTDGEPGKDPVEDPGKNPDHDGPGEAPKPAHKAPSGTIGGKPFAPTHVLLEETSDGGKLGFYAASERHVRDGFRCEEPLGSGSTFEIIKYHPTADWQVGKALESELGDWSATGVDWNAKPKGTAKVTLSKKDGKTFELAGTIEIKGDGWSFSGPFTGDYCPTKVVEREKPAPLAGMEWTLAPVDPAAIPKTPLEAIIAGVPGTIAHVSIREVPYHDGTRRHRLVFFAAAPPEPCAARPEGGHSRIYSFDKLVKVEGPAFRIDNFSIDLPAAPAPGSLAGNYHHQHGEKRDQIIDADLQAFEADGYRGWRYAQYYSAAMVIEEVTDQQVRARTYLALPDQGKSMLVGAFTATRCPPETE